MVKGPNKKTSLSELKEKKKYYKWKKKKKNFTRNLVFQERLRTNQKWPI